MAHTIITTGLRKSFGSHIVLDGVDLSVQEGSVFALLGPNGAGKTTMVRILSTLTRPDAGNAVVAGHDLMADPDGVRRSISLTGQYAALDELLTARENLVMMGRLFRLGTRRARVRAGELLAEFGLAEAGDRRVATYSGGMRRRLDLAVSLIARPPLVFLDEPTTGLDPRSRERMWATVRDLAGSGTTILLTTQYLEEADQLAHRIAMLDGGRIVTTGTADELKASLAGEVAAFEFPDDDALTCALDVLAGEQANRLPERRVVEVVTDGSAAHVHALLTRLGASGAPADRVSLHRPSLDDVFLSLTATEPAPEPNGAAR
jgi:ABC-2 type transport system ATP-binding protein